MKSFYQYYKLVEDGRFERESGFGGKSLSSDEIHVSGSLNKLISMIWEADQGEVIRFLSRMSGKVDNPEFAALLSEIKGRRGDLDRASGKRERDMVVPNIADSGGGGGGEEELSGM